jgi:hypothetical protein
VSAMAFCHQCGARLADGAGYCGSCGTAVRAAPPPMTPPPAPLPPQAPAYARPATPQDAAPAPSQGVAITALVLNIIIWPGLGSLIGGDKNGWAQGFLFLLGFALIFTIIGIVIAIPLMIGMWVWGIVSGVKLIEKANAAERARYAAPPPPSW